MKERIRIAIQKDGRLKDESMRLLRSLGLVFAPAHERSLVIPCQNKPVDICFVRHGSIPAYVEQGVIDVGIVGQNVLYEDTAEVAQMQTLDFGRCRLVIAVPAEGSVYLADLCGKRIATSYPKSLRRYLDTKNIRAEVVVMKGSVEAAPALGLADAVCDLTQTGSTLRDNGLKPIAIVFESTAVLIASATMPKNMFQTLFQNIAIPYENVLS